MRFQSFLLFISLILLAACSSTPSTENRIQATTIYASGFENNFRGLVHLTDNKFYFQRCGSDQEMPIYPQDTLHEIYKNINIDDNTPTYIEFTGEISLPKDQANINDFWLQIAQINYVSPEKISLQCAKYNDSFYFNAKGDNPYWRVNIDHNNLYFASKIHNQVYSVKEASVQTKTINMIKGVNRQHEPLNLTIKPHNCYNFKTKEYWGYMASIDTIWGNFSGCGELRKQNTEKFTGYYANTDSSKISNILLNADYTAEYNDRDETKNTIKTGIWKSNDADQVAVILNSNGSKLIQETLLFKYHNQLLTQQNTVDYFSPNDLTYSKVNKNVGAVNAIKTPMTKANIIPSSTIDQNVQKAVYQYFKSNKTDPKKTQFNSVKYDLNADGIKDAVVLLDWCKDDDCEMLIFEGKKNNKYQFISRISRMMTPTVVSNVQHYLWKSLIINKDKKAFTLNFDGVTYPVNTRNLKEVDIKEQGTDIILFSQGKPHIWFPIAP